jgi:hypothetical protein
MSASENDRVVRKITKIDEYLHERFFLDSEQLTTPQELGLEATPIVLFDPHINADLEKIKSLIGEQDSPVLIANCVGFVRKLLEVTVEGVTPQIDYSQVENALVDEEESEAGPLL